MRATNTLDLDRLAAAIDSDGISSHESAVATLVARARRHGVSPVVTDVLASHTSPEPARLRAFGHVTVALAVLSRGCTLRHA